MIVLGMHSTLPAVNTVCIGADRGALYLAQQGIRMKAAIGDFDSVSSEEKDLIRSMCDEMLELNPIKDDTDSEEAITYAVKEGYSRILVYGGFGGRMDHTLINLKLAEKYAGTVYLLDEHNEISAQGSGIYQYMGSEYRYFSILALDDSVISLGGMKYPLDHRRITTEDLYTTSNEIIAETGTLTVHSGKVLVIRSND
ncbi:MAG: thiamine diphosphokinase [Solobacterium sp.]|nr:thiamine diphosphokinase [Solobacterium sp.]